MRKDVSRRTTLQMIATAGIGGLGINALSSSAEATSDQSGSVSRASGQQTQEIAQNGNYRKNKDKAEELGYDLKLGQTLVVDRESNDIPKKFVVPTEPVKQIDNRSPPLEINGYHAVLTTRGTESILYFGGDDFYGSGTTSGGQISQGSAIQFDIPGYSSKEVHVDDVCDELTTVGEDVVCFGATGYTSLKTLAKKAIPYIGGAITAVCAVKSEACARWPRVYKNATGVIPAEGCKNNHIVLYKAKSWNPIRNKLTYFMTPVCEP